MDKIPITYDSIFEILMREKGSEELQKLPPDFFNNLIEYISEKKKTAESTATDPFSRQEKERKTKELKNISGMLTELYERREKKILNMAMIRSRTGADIVDTSGLLAEEKMLFDSLIAQLDHYRSNILQKILEARPTAAEDKPEGSYRGRGHGQQGSEVSSRGAQVRGKRTGSLRAPLSRKT